MAEAIEIAKDFIPSFGSGSLMISIVVWLIIAIIFLILVGIATFLVVRHLKFNRKIVIFERINGQFQPTGKDRAMPVKFSTSGDTIFYLRKRKKYLPNPTIQTGARTYWYFVREDDEWINFGPGDFDEDAKELKARMLDKEMRYARTQVQRGLKDRYDKPGFWKQYGLLVLSIVYITIIGVMFWLALGKFVDLAGALSGVTDSTAKLLDRADSILGAMDNLCSGGSGITN